MSVHVNSDLDQDQRICRQLSFYDLVELMSFGRLSFDQSSRVRLASSRLPSKAQRMTAEITAGDVQSLPTETAIQASPASAAIAYQSWTLLGHDCAMDWGADDASASSIHIVSTIGALAEALLVGEESDVFIDRTSRWVFSPAQRRSAPANPVPIPDDATLTVALWPKNSPIGEDQRSAPRLPVDLRTLLTGVLVSPQAPGRFVELVAALVQRMTRAQVSRASWPMESLAAGASHAGGA